MRQARAGHDTRGQRVTPRCRWARARPGFEATRREKLAARTARGRVATHRHTQRPDTTGVEGTGRSGGPAAVPMGGGKASPGFEATRQAKLAARTARGRAAAHGNNQQPGPAGRAKRPARQHTTRRHKKHSTGARARRPAPPALQLRREYSEVLTSRVAQLAQLVNGGDPAAALAFGGEQVHAADR